MNKRFIRKEFVFPILIAAAAAAVITVILFVFTGRQYFYNNNVEVAKLGTADAATVEKGTDKDVRSLIKPDAAIGSVRVGDTELGLVFSPDYADTKGNFCQLDNGILISEIGNAVIYCNKKNGASIRALAAGDIVRIKTFYGEYEYRVVDRETFSQDPAEHSFAGGIGRGVTLCTPKDNRVGLSREYVAVHCELVSGLPIEDKGA